MAVGQARDHRHLDRLAQPGDDFVQVIAIVMRRQLVIAEAAQHDGLLLVQDAGLPQLDQHALDAVRMLGHVLQEQDAAAHLGHVRRAQQRRHHRQVAAPQDAAAIDRIGVLGLEAENLQLATHDLAEQRLGQVVDLLAAEIGDGGRAGVADRAGLGQQGQVEGGEVAQADEALAAVGNGLPVDQMQQPAQAVAAARRHDDGQLLLDGARQAGQTLGVGAGEALVHGQRRAVQRGLEALGLQALARQRHGVGIAHGRGRRNQVNAARVRQRVGMIMVVAAVIVADMAVVVMRVLVVGVVIVGGLGLAALGLAAHALDSLLRRSRKNRRSRSPQVSASTPPVTEVW